MLGVTSSINTVDRVSTARKIQVSREAKIVDQREIFDLAGSVVEKTTISSAESTEVYADSGATVQWLHNQYPFLKTLKSLHNT